MGQLQYHGLSEYDRFFKRVQIKGTNECWPWLGSRKLTKRSGAWYGQWRAADGSIEGTHRAVWRLTKGPILDGLHVLHRCDNPVCVNPTHLFLGTQSINSKDMWRKGRGVTRGEGNGNAKLTPELVRDIRSSKEKSVELARRTGMSQQTICDIRKRRSWRHIV